MTLREQQSFFARLVGYLIAEAYARGYELTLGDAYRDKRCPYGAKRSNHRRRLAIDLNLFINGDYQRTTEAHRPLGEWWEDLHPGCRWGGRFNDGNHYEFVENWRNENGD